MTATVEVFDPVPSWRLELDVVVRALPADDGSAPLEAIGLPVTDAGDVLEAPLWTRTRSWSGADLRAAGLDGTVGQALTVETTEIVQVIAYGVGTLATLTTASLRHAAAACARLAARHRRLTLILPATEALSAADAAQAATEGALLARYRYTALRHDAEGQDLTELTLLVAPEHVDEAERGARRGAAFARATAMARDLANSPPSRLTAERLADCAQEVATAHGLEVEVFDQDALIELGCGGLLGVNAGSVEPPRMIKLKYRPRRPGAAQLTLVGKGVMYDSGGIALKPADAVHATMKNDMSGAGAILAAMAVLAELDCPTEVTGYLMCTDNMPSGSATKLGDVLTIRGGTTVEVINTDAEGRLVMADALVLATEEPTDAIVDIATLTGACMRALGTQIAGVFGNQQALVDQVLAASDRVDELAWQLPLARLYRRELNSDVADIKNLGGANGGAIHAALFLEEFVAGRPWAHIDIAGTAQAESAGSWRSAGCTGFGARLLIDLALTFTPPATAGRPAGHSRTNADVQPR